MLANPMYSGGLTDPNNLAVGSNGYSHLAHQLPRADVLSVPSYFDPAATDLDNSNSYMFTRDISAAAQNPIPGVVVDSSPLYENQSLLEELRRRRETPA